MKAFNVLAIALLAGTPAIVEGTSYTFDVTSGSVVLGIPGDASTSGGLSGHFAVTMYDTDAHVGESDTFVLDGAALSNSTYMKLSIGPIARMNLYPGDVRVLDFLPSGPGHIGPGGLSVVETDVYLEATALVTGAFMTTLTTAAWQGELRPYEMSFTTTASASDILTATLSGTYSWVNPMPDIGVTITFDFIISVEGTAHVVPDPSLVGVTTLGVAGAAGWLRRRRA